MITQLLDTMVVWSTTVPGKPMQLFGSGMGVTLLTCLVITLTHLDGCKILLLIVDTWHVVIPHGLVLDSDKEGYAMATSYPTPPSFPGCPIATAPTPTAFKVDQVRLLDGTFSVFLAVFTGQGIQAIYIPGDIAEKLASEIKHVGGFCKANMQVPDENANGVKRLVVPGQN